MADHKIMFEALSELRKKRKGKYYENIVGYIKNNHGWADDLIAQVIESMIGENLIHKVKVNEKFSYRVVKNDTAYFFDKSSTCMDNSPTNDAENASTNSDSYFKESFNTLQQDFVDFQLFVTNKLAELSEYSCTCTKVNHSPVESSDEIKILKNHINSLERQLNEKQKVIDGL